jgi:hypothetical protein
MDVEQARFAAAQKAVPGATTVTNGSVPSSSLLQSQTIALPPDSSASPDPSPSPQGPSPAEGPTNTGLTEGPTDTGLAEGPTDTGSGPDVAAPANGKRKILHWAMVLVALGAAALLMFLLYRLLFKSCPAPEVTVNPQIDVDVPSCSCTANGGGTKKSPSPSRSSSPKCDFPDDQKQKRAPVVGASPSPKPNRANGASPPPQPNGEAAAAVSSDGISPRSEAASGVPRDVNTGTGITYTTKDQGTMRTSFAQDMVAPYAGSAAFGQFAAGAL